MEKADEAYEKQVADTAEKNQKAVAAADEEHRNNVTKVSEKNRKALDKYQTQKTQVETANREGQERVQQRVALERTVQEESKVLQDGIRETNRSARQMGNEKYETVRQKIGDVTTSPTPVANAVKYAKSNLLQGSPENIRQFEELLKREGDVEAPLDITGGQGGRAISPGEPGYEGIRSAYADAGMLNLERPLSFNDLKGFYTELGEKIYKGSYPSGDIGRALTSVRDAIGREMDSMAERAGAADDLRAADSYWNKFMKTFYDKKSPVAKAMNEFDPGHAGRSFLAESDFTPGVGMLEEFNPELATRARALRAINQQAKALPRSYSPKAVPEAPKLEEIPPKPQPKITPMPERTAPDISAAKTKQLKLSSRYLRQPRGRMLGFETLRQIHGASIGDARVQELLSTLNPEEQQMVQDYLNKSPRQQTIAEGEAFTQEQAQPTAQNAP